ncbi:APC family permease [Rhodococcus rhodnii]|uniref:Amino acid transporter n=2 Tax=Rhodococcus rhodnii TaxID=38312 RepID=R7WPC4_9NOCA|nr:APC family permease [Rhodococcus rhodnii]EOM77172.1 amino acid transporter [Rhodococcus rhodnii LMG 5362]TXG91951.1 APC family permease [Rhodococcus rhodnii]
MSALSDAIARSFSVREPDSAPSPLSALGRRRLSGAEVFAQSVATTAPAASMVIVPVTLIAHGMLLSGLVVIVLATILISSVALCVSQFTRRMIAAGGLYSFVAQGLGRRSALTSALAMLAKYLASASMTLYHGGYAVVTLLGAVGIDASGTLARVCIYGTIAIALLSLLVRGVKVAAIAILVVEACSLVFIVVLMVFAGSSGQPPQVSPADTPSMLAIVLVVIFSLAGFESATFVGPEARRPYTSVTRTVLWTPVVCGALFVFAAWATWSGRSGTVVNAYLHGTSTGVDGAVVVTLQAALTFSWLASATASANAASRLLYTLGLERTLPHAFSRVHLAFRTPATALAAFVTVIAAAAITTTVVGRTVVFAQLQPVTRAAVIASYVLVAVASVAFVRRIREQTPAVMGACGAGTTAGVGVVAAMLWTNLQTHTWNVPVVIVGLGMSGCVWYLVLRRRAPRSLLRIGVFDRPGSDDVLPGAGRYDTDAVGDLVLSAEPGTAGGSGTTGGRGGP